jgi:O-antigen/teichoic acid export membrane protein
MSTTASHSSIDDSGGSEDRELGPRLLAITNVPAPAAEPPTNVPAPTAPTSDRQSPFKVRKVVRAAPTAERGQPSEAGGKPSEAGGKPSDAGHRVARNLGALVGGQLVTWTMTLVWTLIVPRVLGPVDFGILVSAQSVSGVLGIALGIGAQNYLVRETVIDRSAGPRLVGTVLVLRIALIPLVGLAALLWARLAHYGHTATVVLYLVTAMTVFTLLMEPVQAAFQAIERMKYIAYANVINKVAQSIIGIALVFVGFKAVGIAWDMAIIAGLVFLLSCWWLRPYFRIDPRTNVSLMARVTKESAAYGVYAVFGTIYLWIDTIMLTLMTRSTVVGWYGASTQLFQTLLFLPVFVQAAWLPRLVTAFGKSRRDLRDMARAPVELVLMLSLPIAAGTIVVADPLIHAVYGTGFAQAIPVLIVLGLCIPPLYLNIILASVLIAEKRQSMWTTVMICAAVLNPLLNLVLIPLTEHRYHNGAIGAAISLVLTELALSGVALFVVGRHVFEARMVKRCALMGLLSALMVAVAQLARPLGSVPSVVVGFTTFGVLVVLLRVIRPEEWALARSGIARARARVTRSRPDRAASERPAA